MIHIYIYSMMSILSSQRKGVANGAIKIWKQPHPYNQMKISSRIIALQLLLVAVLTLSLRRKEEHAPIGSFCWKDSYWRGFGSLSNSCGYEQQKIGLLCYDNCPTWTCCWGFDCHSYCLQGFRDDGLFCRNAEYGRGWGYAWYPSDGFNYDGAGSRCEADEGYGNCEQYMAMFYPKCKPGYSNFGCCICRPEVPDCPSLGLSPGIDLSCAKKVIIGSSSLGGCNYYEERYAGICYPTCQSGYSGVGPICWGQPPPGWVECGMGAASDEYSCTSATFDQVSSVGSLALRIATLGTSGAIKVAIQSGREIQRLQQIKNKFKRLRNTLDTASDLKTKADYINSQVSGSFELENSIEEAKTLNTDTASAEDMVRISSNLAAIADPTGIAGAISAYTYSKCSQMYY